MMPWTVDVGNVEAALGSQDSALMVCPGLAGNRGDNLDGSRILLVVTERPVARVYVTTCFTDDSGLLWVPSESVRFQNFVSIGQPLVLEQQVTPALTEDVRCQQPRS